MNNNDLIDKLIAKICHDLLNPLSTAQMALESGSMEYIKPALDDLIIKVDMFRSLYRDGIDDTIKYNKLNQYIEAKKLSKEQFKMDYTHPHLSSLIFWILEKSINKSYIYIEKEAIHLQRFFLDEEEIDILQNKLIDINSRNILLFITIKKLEKEYLFKIEELGSNEWKIIIIKNK